MPEAAIPLVAEEAVGATAAELTAEQIAAQQLLAEQQAAAALEAQQAAEAAQAAQAAQQATNEAIRNTVTQTPVSPPGTGGIVDLGTSPEVLQQLQSVKGPLDISSAAANTYNGPGSISNFGELVNPFETLPPAAPPVAGPPAAPAVAPTAPPPAPPSMPPPEYGYTGAPPPEPLVESASTAPINPSSPVQATSTPLRTSGGFDTGGFEGIDILAKEVGVMPGVQSTISAYGAGAPTSTLPTTFNSAAPGIDKLIHTNLSSMGSNLAPTLGTQTSAFNTTAPTLTQYGAGAPTSTLPTSFNPAAPMANPTYAQSGLQGLQTNLSGPLGSNLPPPSVPQAVNPVGADQFTQMQVRGALTGEGMNPGVYQEAVAKTPFSPVGSTPTQVAGNVSNFGANTLQPFETTPEYADAMKEAYRGMEPVKAVSGETIYPQTIGTGAPAPEAGGLQSAWQDFTKMSLPNKLLTGMMASSAYEMLNRPKPYEKPKYKSTWNAGAYSGFNPVQPTPYTPNYAHGGLADLGGYSDGGRMLKGPGDGMSDDIPATIANKQPARLANEEFVVPADVVSHLGNGSSEAGAKQLYKMMDRVRRARTGNKKQGKQINPEKYLA